MLFVENGLFWKEIGSFLYLYLRYHHPSTEKKKSEAERVISFLGKSYCVHGHEIDQGFSASRLTPIIFFDE